MSADILELADDVAACAGQMLEPLSPIDDEWTQRQIVDDREEQLKRALKAYWDAREAVA
jgi:hypothetical protein